MKIIKSTQKNYPEKLLKIKNYPKKLYVEGNLELFDKPIVAIVGSRDCSEYGKEQAKRFSEELSKKGICIISGLARGIDTIAHINSIEKEGKTIAVLASGFKNIYPPENKILVEKIVNSGGAVISEFQPDEEIDMSKFPRRNRIISGLADAILVIEAKYRSGSTITARYGFRQNKEVFCIPGNISEKNSYGTNKLIQEGASLVISPMDILNSLNYDECDEKINIDGKYKEVYENIGTIPVSVNEISKRANRTIQEINEILFMLEVDGFIKSLPGDKYVVKE